MRILKTKALLTSMVLGLAVPLATQAQEYDWYVDSSLGASYLKADGATDRFDDNSSALRLTVGRNVHSNLAIDVGFMDFGDLSDEVLGAQVDIDFSTLQLSALASIEAGRFDLFARVGVAAWDIDILADNLGIVQVAEADGEALLLGLGASTRLEDRFALRCEWSWYDVDDYDNVSTLTVGATWYF